MNQSLREQNQDGEFKHWGRVYFAVIATLVIVIIALWVFSKAFE
ncbi:MAG TPA: hypothetical protein VEF04_06265 [Blastocatellia bacterium]|nr:hypothetical protein [Blastocatellia bacterium]